MKVVYTQSSHLDPVYTFQQFQAELPDRRHDLKHVVKIMRDARTINRGADFLKFAVNKEVYFCQGK